MKTLTRNVIRNDHAKFGEASSIRSGRKVGGTESRKKKERKKEEEEEEDTFSGSKTANFKQSQNPNYLKFRNAVNGTVLGEVQRVQIIRFHEFR